MEVVGLSTSIGVSDAPVSVGDESVDVDAEEEGEDSILDAFEDDGLKTVIHRLTDFTNFVLEIKDALLIRSRT